MSVYFQSPAGPGALAAAATGVGAHGAGPLTQARRLQVASGVIQLESFFKFATGVTVVTVIPLYSAEMHTCVLPVDFCQEMPN